METRIGLLVLLGIVSHVASTAPGSAQTGSARRVLPAPSGPLDSLERGSGQKQVVARAGDVNGDGYGDVILGLCLSTPGNIPGPSEVRVHLGQGSGLAPTAVWRVVGDQPEARLGEAVASAGDVNGDGFDDVLVGAPGRSAGLRGEGHVSLYLGSAQGLAAAPAWTADGGQLDAGLGSAVSGAGDVNGDGFDDVLVAAARFDAGETDEGRVFLYLGSAAGLGASPAWTADGNQVDARMGAAVASAGDVDGDGFADVIVGAPGHDVGAIDAGRVRVYAGSASGLLALPAWIVDGSQAGEGFGWALSAGDLDGDGYGDVIVGAPLHDALASDAGGAWAYLGGAGGLASAPAWTAEGDGERAWFGWSVAGAGNLNTDTRGELIVGAPGQDALEPDAGRVFLYRGGGFGPNPGPCWTAAGDVRALRLGTSVAGAGDVDGDGRDDLLVGTIPPTKAVAGEIRVFYGAQTVQEHDWMAEGDAYRAHLGHVLASAGDVDGDGHDDLIAGAPDHGGNSQQGRAVVYMGSPYGPEPQAAWTLESLDYFYLGVSVASAGDVDGDGYGDVVIATGTSEAMGYRDAVLVFHGSASGLPATPDWSVLFDEAGFGGLQHRVSGAGDVNGDGYDDVIVGSPNYYVPPGSGYSDGRALVFLGGAAGLSAQESWSYVGAHALMGRWVSSAGDVNGDGFDDVLVAAAGSLESPEIKGGMVLVFLGSSGGLASTPVWTLQSDVLGEELGNRVAGAGDVNGDGYDDVLVTSRFSYPGHYEGAAFLYLGSPAGPAISAAWSVTGGPYANYGSSIAGAGDVNGDGFDDVVVGAASWDGTVGRAYLYLGSSSGLATSAARTITRSPSEQFGDSAAGVGDLNADGFDDWAVAAPYLTNGQLEEGAVFVYLGSP